MERNLQGVCDRLASVWTSFSLFHTAFMLWHAIPKKNFSYRPNNKSRTHRTELNQAGLTARGYLFRETQSMLILWKLLFKKMLTSAVWLQVSNI